MRRWSGASCGGQYTSARHGAPGAGATSLSEGRRRRLRGDAHAGRDGGYTAGARDGDANARPAVPAADPGGAGSDRLRGGHRRLLRSRQGVAGGPPPGAPAGAATGGRAGRRPPPGRRRAGAAGGARRGARAHRPQRHLVSGSAAGPLHQARPGRPLPLRGGLRRQRPGDGARGEGVLLHRPHHARPPAGLLRPAHQPLHRLDPGRQADHHPLPAGQPGALRARPAGVRRTDDAPPQLRP